jgi:hypothetical protein
MKQILTIQIEKFRLLAVTPVLGSILLDKAMTQILFVDIQQLIQKAM